jgi:hypothetical protein
MYPQHKLLVCMELFWDLLFQLMKHGTNTLHVAFIFLSSIRSTQIRLHGQGGEILDQHSYSERLDTHAIDLSSDLTYHQASSCCDPCGKRAERSVNWSRSSCSVFTMFFLLAKMIAVLNLWLWLSLFTPPARHQQQVPS